MKPQPRHLAVVKAEAAWRYALLNTATRVFPSVIMTEFPKSGGTWLCQMLSESLKMPYTRNWFPSIGRNIYQGHFLKRYPGQVLVQWRDPRDILVSLYHFLYFRTDYASQARIDSARAHAGFDDFDDLSGNLEAFVELTFTDPRIPKFSWNDFFDHWHNAEGVVHTSYERLRRDGVNELSRITVALGGTPNNEHIGEIVDQFSFERVSGRKVGDENRNSFLRKGIVGDWANVFTPEAIAKLETLTDGRMAAYEALMASLPATTEESP